MTITQQAVRLLIVSLGLSLAACGGSDDASPTDPDAPPNPPPGPNQPPTASFQLDIEEGVAPLEVRFNGGSSFDPDGTIVSYSWDFGDGTAGSGALASHSYHSAGLFVVRLAVQDERGGEDTARDTVYVSSTPGSGSNAIEGLVWFDRDASGDRQAGEPGLARFKVFLDGDGDGELDVGERLAFSRSDGSYRFDGLEEGGSHTVTQALPLGWTNTAPGLPELAQVPPSSLGRGPARIINGTAAEIQAFPFQVALIQNPFGNTAQFCGGTLISGQWVLTAAHCVADRLPGDVDVLLGTAELGQGGERVSVTAIRYKPDYGVVAPLDSDIAVLRLERPLLRPRSFLQTPDQEALSTPGTLATVIGWGLTESGSSSLELLRADLPIITNQECNDIVGDSYGLITANSICAGGVAIGKGPCYGDSGGPLLVPHEGGWVQVGIVSFGRECGGVPGVFARVSTLLAWVTGLVPVERSGTHEVDWSGGSTYQADFGNFH